METIVKIVGLDPEVNDLYKHHFQSRDIYINNIKNCIGRVLEHKHQLEIKQEITFYMRDGRAKVIKFNNGKQTSVECIRIIQLRKAIEYGNSKIPFEIVEQKREIIESFDCSAAHSFDARIIINITGHCPFIADGWTLSLQVIKQSTTSVDFYRAKEFKAKLFVPINRDNFLSIIPWKNGDMIFLYLTTVGDQSLSNLAWVTETFAPTLIDKCALQVQDIYVKVADKTGFEVNKFHTGEYAIKQLMPRVTTMDHSNFAEFILSIDKYFITDKINGTTTVCVVENDILYIAGGNETYDFPLVGFNGWIFDAELVHHGDRLLLYPFDVRHAEEPLHNSPFANRWMHFKKLEKMNGQLKDVHIINKRWLNLAFGQDKIAEFDKQFVANPMYPTDGYVFVYGQRLEYKNSMYQATKCFKWKPRDIITVDFYVTECKFGQHPYVCPMKNYTTVLLCNGIDARLQLIIPDLIQIPIQGSEKYNPVMFRPSCNPYRHIAYIETSKVASVVGNICEFSLDSSGQWHLERIRTDRVNELNRGLSFGNDHRIAELNLFAIDHPITLKDLVTTTTVEQVNDLVKRVGPAVGMDIETIETIRSIYNAIKQKFSMSEYVLDHTNCGFAFEKEKKSMDDINHIMVTSSEVNAINFINSKYFASHRNYSYYIFGKVDSIKVQLEKNMIRYPISGAKLVISMFACEATTLAEMDSYLVHLTNLMHKDGRLIICWSESFGQSKHGFDIITEACRKRNLMINEFPHEVRNVKFVNFKMYIINK